MNGNLLRALKSVGQQHLLDFWEELDPDARLLLQAEIEGVDMDLVKALYEGQEESPDWVELAGRAEPPVAVRMGSDEHPEGEAIRSRGEAALRDGRVGMILVAGGQGTRLGFDHPKGMFSLGPISRRTLFQIIIDKLRAVARRYEVKIPLFLMTSPVTHDETVDFLARHDRCGLADEDLKIFRQGVMPAVDAKTGRILRRTRGSLALSPDGHGGMLAALAQSGCLDRARRRGIELLFYGQIDNPLLQVCDPWLLGCHLSSDSEMTTQVVRKAHPREKVGNVVQIDGRTRIIEYSDLPDDAAEQREPDGSLRLWAGSLAVHVFDRAFLERMVDQSDQMPYHRARKKSEFVDDQGRAVVPDQANSIKFERFIFDLLPAARHATVVESAKEDAFAPVKNADGEPEDTPEHARKAMVQRDARMLRQAGATVSDGIEVEINPLWALDAAEVARKIDPGTTIDSPTYFTDN